MRERSAWRQRLCLIMWIPEEMSQDFKNGIYLFIWIMAFSVKKSIKPFAPFGSKTLQGDALFLMYACSVSVRISLWLGEERTPFQGRVLLRHALSWLWQDRKHGLCLAHGCISSAQDSTWAQNWCSMHISWISCNYYLEWLNGWIKAENLSGVPK